VIAQGLFSILLSGVLVYAWAEYRRSPAVSLMALAASLSGLLFVWAPSLSTLVAEFVGIGRGVDLILYLWVCISLILLLNLHLKLRTQEERIAKLARAIAIRSSIGPAETPAPRQSASSKNSHGDDAGLPIVLS
jgi:small membrane protein